MKLQELIVTERLYIDFFISASNECTKFVAQHTGVTTRYNDVRVWFSAKAAYGAFKLLYVLHFVNKDIIVLVVRPMLFNIFIEIPISLYGIILLLLLIYIDNIIV